MSVRARLWLGLALLAAVAVVAYVALAQMQGTSGSAGGSTGAVESLSSDAPLPNVYSFIVWGDNRPDSYARDASYGPGWQHVRDKMASLPHAFEVVAGDIVHVDPGESLESVNEKYANLFSQMGATRDIPKSYAIGNHEEVGRSSDAAQAWEQSIHPAHYDVFTHGAGTPDEPRTTVINLSTWEPEHLGTIGYQGEDDPGNSAQADWLVDELKARAGEPESILVVNMHHPVVDPKHDESYDEDDAERVALQELFEEYGVDLVIAGHVHAYVRHVMPDGTPYVTQGMAGSPPKSETYSAHHGPGTDAVRIGSPDPGREQFGFTRFFVTNDGRLTAETYVTSETDWTWRVGDSFSVPMQEPAVPVGID